jgi:pre-mRNA-splicing factor ATP-dependent RNA helicase DHX15/PRP43
MSNTNNIGILDPDGKNLNPLTNAPYGEKYTEFAAKWKKLPAYAQAKKYIQVIKTNNVILVTADTGSGKTVIFPKLLLHALNYASRIIVTLPKQKACKDAATYSSLTMDVKLGSFVNYMYRGAGTFVKDHNQLLYSTDGSVISLTSRDKLLSKFDGIVIDEAHERKINIDFLIYISREILKKRKDFKVIIMSATMDTNLFKTYFSKFKVDIINILGNRQYPIDVSYIPTNRKEYIKAGIKVIKNILENEDISNDECNDILFFVTSHDETLRVCSQFKNEMKSNIKIVGKECTCIELYAGSPAESRGTLETKESNSIRVIVATNLAESSLTIKGIKFVIDSGYEYAGEFDYRVNATNLTKKLISKAQSTQRRGRAGRVCAGKCYCLYDETMFKHMKEYPLPDILINDISIECIRLMLFGNIDSIESLNKILNEFINPPDQGYIDNVIERLKMLSLLNNGILTSLGKQVSNMGMFPEMAVTIINSITYNCHKDVFGIVSIMDACKLNINSLFLDLEQLARFITTDDSELNNNLKKIRDDFKIANAQYISKDSDLKTILNIYNDFLKHDDHGEGLTYCKQHFIQYNMIKDARKRKMQMDRNIPINEYTAIINDKVNSLSDSNKILYCFATGYLTNVCVMKNGTYNSLYIDNINLENSFIEPSSKVVVCCGFNKMGGGRIKGEIVSNIPDEVVKLIKIPAIQTS